MLNRDRIIAMYKEANLTPVLVVKGGSRAFNCTHYESDFDYYGYHVEDTKKDEYHVVGDPNSEYINSLPFNDMNEYMFNKGAYIMTFSITNWLWSPVVYESERAIEYREQVVRVHFEGHKSLFINAIKETAETTRRLGITASGIFDKQFQKYHNAIHLYLVAHHLETTDELQCDYEILKTLYGINTNDITRLSDLQTILEEQE